MIKHVIINSKYFRGIPENYKIILMQGGGTGAFASVALNLMHRGEKADYILTGYRFLFIFNALSIYLIQPI